MRTKLRWQMNDSVFSGKTRRKKVIWFDISKEETTCRLVCLTHYKTAKNGRLLDFPKTCTRKCEIHWIEFTPHEFDLFKKKSLSERLRYRAKCFGWIT